jgi:hypothetical protein
VGKVRIKTKPAGQMPLEGMGLIESKRRIEKPADEGFNAFWAAYPRKVDKHQARINWDKLMKEPGLKIEDILMGLRSQLPVLALNGPFVPHPATWLRHRRWLDVVEHIAPAPATESEKLLRACIDRYLQEGKL